MNVYIYKLLDDLVQLYTLDLIFFFCATAEIFILWAGDTTKQTFRDECTDLSIGYIQLTADLHIYDDDEYFF